MTNEICLFIVLVVTVLHLFTARFVNRIYDLNLANLNLTLENSMSIVRQQQQINKLNQRKGMNNE